jgi:serine phosphatase RsbU (regulator of sigma subunit)
VCKQVLAAEIHRVLVPPIDTKVGDFEFHGRSLPSGEVGGDLIDLAGSEDHWVAYVADVSGHGVAPGVAMGIPMWATWNSSTLLRNSG